MIPITHPFGFAQGRLFSQSARKGWGTRLDASALLSRLPHLVVQVKQRCASGFLGKVWFR